MGRSRQWAADLIKSGLIFEIIVEYNRTAEENEKLEIPLHLTNLKKIPFDGSNLDKENVVPIWRKALEIAKPYLPSTKDVYKAVRKCLRGSLF